ncbi:conserved hypothetical protein [Leishmania mexicana MHOM/GT/2001/U1103]|uniref:PH-like domain-containing protein n=1 Tax=Leishmania mexicana (strain MHOM/GT/2001/U1103) TaxID=929439 RepID=E9AJC3_LEIMU|nr:conserved hypothetical protein [Leishmania mexicana MHOM/GT/2001/U1103]CBZ23020.1 conserved hypothetical protein [Leishmania mexicana MHOM/GT/2001/U1103]
MSSLEALLSSPTDVIAECPVLGPSDVRVVVANLEVILNKCLYSVRRALPGPLEVLLIVIGDASDLQASKVCAGLLQPAEEGTCADVFCDLAEQLLARRAAVIRLQFDVEVFFKVMQVFCCAASLKDRLGARLGEVLLGFLKDVDMHADDYRVHRNCCSALISLLRGSQENKSRLGPECATIAACLDASSDFFFQMQCVEVLYRLYKHRNCFLAHAAAPANAMTLGVAINPSLLRAIEALPNDSTLLHCIHQLLDSYNRDVHPDKVIAFSVLHIEVAGVTMARATTLYFSPLLLVVLLPDTGSSSSSSGGGGGGGGGYLTIPYEHVRSVKLTKDHKLELRLYVIPPKLSHVMSLAQEGRDKLYVSLTRATMRELRTSIVHEWVAERKRTAPRRVTALVPPPPSRRTEAARAGHALPSTSSTSPAPPSSSHASSSRTGSTVRPPLTTTMTERPVNTHQGVGLDSHHQALARPKAPHPQFVVPVQEQQQQQQHQAQQEQGGPAYMNSSGDYAAADEEAGGQCERPCLEEVHRAASLKAMRYREEQHEALQHAVDSAKEELEALHRWSARERDQYEVRFREDMEVIRRSEAVLKESATDCVRALNAELEDVQALGALLKGEVDKLRERLAKSLGKSEGVEEALLTRIKHTVDAQMRSIEATMLSVDSAASTPATSTDVGGGSISDVSNYIAQQMQAISSGAVVVGAAGARASTAAAAAGGGAVISSARGTGSGRAGKGRHEPQPLKERRLDYS